MKPVDLLESELRRRELKHMMPLLQAMAPEWRYHGYVAAAWAFVKAGDIEEALKLVDLLTADYVQSVMPAQMDQDPVFDTMCQTVANALMEAKVHVPTYIPPPNTFVAPAGLA